LFTVKAVIHLAHTTGALIVGEGVEDIEDAVCLINAGADMLQGYLFAKPSLPHDIQENEINLKIVEVVDRFKTERITEYTKKKSTVEIYNTILKNFTEKLGTARITEFNTILRMLLKGFPEVECAYIIGENGIQISDTAFKSQDSCNSLFRPDSKGADQSFKDYFFYIKAGQKFFVSNPYISAATGEICITISARFLDFHRSSHILCIDMMS